MALRPLTIAGLRVERAFSWVLAGGERGGLPARFKRFAGEAAGKQGL